MPRPDNPFWTEDNITTLKRLRTEGLGAKAMFDYFGGAVSLGSIAYKITMLGLRCPPGPFDDIKLHELREYNIYRGIIARCENPNVAHYHLYGGRGIQICSHWRVSFADFLSDVGYAPSDKHQIDRIDPNGHYEPDNVRWVTPARQANNRRNTRYVVYRGERMPLTDAVRLAGSVIHQEAAWIRLKSGWNIDRALETPRLHISHASKGYQAPQPHRKGDCILELIGTTDR